jgi:glycosyltransferase involved in cell wall biosynthesis
LVIGRLRDGSAIPAALDRFGLTRSVRFVSGLSDQAIVDLYAQAEVAVVPSLYEGFSLPAIEAMACGVPLVATTGGALPEVAGPNGVSALLVRPNDPGSLARAILTALSEPALRLCLGAAGRRRTAERFTWPVTARATAEQYFELLASRPFAGRAGDLTSCRRAATGVQPAAVAREVASFHPAPC